MEGRYRKNGRATAYVCEHYACKLPVNDPSRRQYQLWIFDKSRSAEKPVDGGVFDVSSTGELIVPIDAKLAVTEAFLFAITAEKPGGVVVSDREDLLLLAQVPE